jgi:hypothetical protein
MGRLPPVLLLLAAALAFATPPSATLVRATHSEGAAGAEAQAPRPPCGAGAPPVPAYADEDAPPSVAVWHDVALAGEAACLGRLQGEAQLLVAIAARFRHDGSLDELAARMGAVSRTAGLLYWSTGEQRWRHLITRAAAVTGPDVDWRTGAGQRPDFSAAELRSGATLWFVQNDSRSMGANLYSARATLSEPDRLAVEVVNESAISFLVMTLFEVQELLELHVVERLDGDLWGYYGLAAVRGEPFDRYERSLVNRAAAFHRFVLGKPGDAEPPLAP